MNGTDLRQRLHAGQPVFGTHISSLMNPVATAMAAELEIDFAFFCAEHMPLDRNELGMLCQFYASRGISPIVRVPSPDPTLVTMALDGGAQGVVVPYVETVPQVREAAGAVHCRPIKGEILHNWLHLGIAPDEKVVRFVERFNRDRYLIIGIESLPAIRRLEELIAIPGVDAVFLGPHDLTASMGIPEEYTHPLFLDTVETVIRQCRAHSVGVGLHTHLLKMEPETLQRLLDAGMNFLINGADITLMRDTMNSQLRRLRELTGAIPIPGSHLPSHRIESCIT